MNEPTPLFIPLLKILRNKQNKTKEHLITSKQQGFPPVKIINYSPLVITILIDSKNIPVLKLYHNEISVCQLSEYSLFFITHFSSYQKLLNCINRKPPFILMGTSCFILVNNPYSPFPSMYQDGVQHIPCKQSCLYSIY